jgi:DNA-binding HxlR family transcriptional regulator
MEPYGQYCPIVRAAEILGDRWTPLIIREFIVGTHRFNDFERGLPGISRPLLAKRLRQLEREGVIERRPAANGKWAEYHLTTAGRGLEPILYALGNWGARWAFGDPRKQEQDPALLLWWMRRRINRHLLPRRRVVVRFDVRGSRRSRLWLVLEPKDVSVCLQDPGFDVDLVVSAHVADLYRAWLGRIPLNEALRDGTIQVDGIPTLARAFPRWLQLSRFVDAVSAVVQGRPQPLRTRTA